MTHIEYTLNKANNCESILEGSIEDIVYGLAHLVATIGWDCTDDHERESAEATVKAVTGFISDFAPVLLKTLFEGDTEPYPEETLHSDD